MSRCNNVVSILYDQDEIHSTRDLAIASLRSIFDRRDSRSTIPAPSSKNRKDRSNHNFEPSVLVHAPLLNQRSAHCRRTGLASDHRSSMMERCRMTSAGISLRSGQGSITTMSINPEPLVQYTLPSYHGETG
jgi:hypothetical protein